jgi:hypothetical protein
MSLQDRIAGTEECAVAEHRAEIAEMHREYERAVR